MQHIRDSGVHTTQRKNKSAFRTRHAGKSHRTDENDKERRLHNMDGRPELRIAKERARMHGEMEHDEEERQWARRGSARADAAVRSIRGRYPVQAGTKNMGEEREIKILQCDVHGER